MLRRIFSLKFLLWTLGGLTALVLIFIAEENWRGRRAWENYRATAEKRGVKLFLRDFIQPDIPDEENYAATPLIREMFAEKKPEKTSSTPFALPRENRPKLGDFTNGRRTDFGEWQQYFFKSKLLGVKIENPVRGVLHALEKFGPALQQLRDASPRPSCKFPTKWDKGIETPLPHLAPLQNAGILFAILTEARLAEGDHAAAITEFHHAMRLREALGSEPSFIAGLLRLNELDTLERVIWSGLASHKWADAESAAIQQSLSQLRLLDELQFGLESERGSVPETILGLTAKSADEISRTISGTGVSPQWGSKLQICLYPKGWLFLDVVAMHEGLDALLAPYKAASHSGKQVTIGDTVSAQVWLRSHGLQTDSSRRSHPFVNFFLSVFDAGQRKYFAAHTQQQQTMLGCALERFQKAHGAFPLKLDELVPQFISTVPLDVCDGNALRYRRNNDGGYDIWSIGKNRKDDGGKIDPEKTFEEQDDWIWHMPGSPKTP